MILRTATSLYRKPMGFILFIKIQMVRLGLRSGCSVALLIIFFHGDLRAQETLLQTNKVRIKQIKLTGNSVISTEELEPILNSYVDQEMDYLLLQKVAEDITEEFRKRGFSLARAYLPQQEIYHGRVEIAVLEGRVGDIIVKGNKHYSSDFIRKGFTRVIDDKAIKHNSVEKSLLLLNEYPDLRVTAVLEAGKEPGTTDIVASVEDKLPLHGAVDYNNFGTNYVSKHRFGVELSLGKFLVVEGSSLTMRGLIGAKTSELHYGTASYLMPLNNYGTKLGFSAQGGVFSVGNEFAELGITGNSFGYAINASHPFVKSRFAGLSGEFGFYSTDTKQTLLDEPYSLDKIRALKAGLNYSRTDVGGRSLLGFYIFQGLGNNLGGMENNDPQSSRLGADNRFRKFNLQLARVQRLGEHVSLLWKASAQASNNSLVAGEQFYLGGADSVRGYPQGEYLGDDGYNVSTEIRLFPLPDKEMLQLLFFLDHGGVSTKKPSPGTKSYYHLTGVGYGLRLKLPYQIGARFDVGFPIQPTKTSSGERPALTIQVEIKF